MVLTGGEPFLRNDIAEVCESAVRRMEPSVVVIPTNGSLPARIRESVGEILKNCPRTRILVNVSLDDIGERHDEIRGLQASFERAVETLRRLREIEDKNLELKIHTVISKYNCNRIPEIYEYLRSEFDPGLYIAEIAEERVELDTVGADIAPSLKAYTKAVDYLSGEIAKGEFSGLSRITQAFRLEYYELVKRILAEKRQVIPCYAGIASAQIAPNGDVWACCVRAEPMGNLRESNYDFQTVWLGRRARELRNGIKAGECACPLANAAYTNMLMHWPTLARVVWRMITGYERFH